MMKSLISTVVVCLLWLVPMSQCSSVYWPMDEKLIRETCKNTKVDYYGLCVPLLKSDPRSKNANLKGLALIMIEIVKDRATTALNQINMLLKKSPLDPNLKYCSEKIYIPTINEHIPWAWQAVRRDVNGSDAGVAAHYMHSICNDVASCQDAFEGRSPITVMNQNTVKVATLAEAIALELLQVFCCSEIN